MTNLQLLEEQILDCWNITSDILSVSNSVGSLSDDDTKRVLEGMRILYDIKFDLLFNTYSQVLQEAAKRS